MCDDQNLLGEQNINSKALRFSLAQRYCTTNIGLLQNERILTMHLHILFSESYKGFCILLLYCNNFSPLKDFLFRFPPQNTNTAKYNVLLFKPKH